MRYLLFEKLERKPSKTEHFVFGASIISTKRDLIKKMHLMQLDV